MQYESDQPPLPSLRKPKSSVPPFSLAKFSIASQPRSERSTSPRTRRSVASAYVAANDTTFLSTNSSARVATWSSSSLVRFGALVKPSIRAVRKKIHAGSFDIVRRLPHFAKS